MHGRKRSDMMHGQPGFVTVPLLAHRDRDATWTPGTSQHPAVYTPSSAMRWGDRPAALERRALSGSRARPPAMGAGGLAAPGRQRDKFVALPEEADDGALPLIEEPPEVHTGPGVSDDGGLGVHLGALTTTTSLPAPGIFEDLPRPVETAWRGRIT
jgi:hypothetical protein